MKIRNQRMKTIVKAMTKSLENLNLPRIKNNMEVIYTGDSEDSDEDMVNNPKHYNRFGIECIDGIEASMTTLEFQGMLKGNTIKYLWRYNYKERPIEDLKKAQWYLDKLIKTMEDTKDE